MNKKEIIWYSFERDAVPHALNGSVDVRLNGPALTFGSPRPREGDIVIGFAERPNYQKRIPPLLIVTNESSTMDVFSWLSTYAPETFPLSQFARVVSDADWKIFSLKESQESPTYEYEDRWAAVILGELLAQGESDAELASIPLSRSIACFSMAIARTSLIYARENSAFSTCISRLKKIERDVRFIRRPVAILELTKVWEVLQQHEHRRDEYNDSLDVRMHDAISLVLYHQGVSEKNVQIHLENYPGLTRNSMEERVLAFQKMILDIGPQSTNEIPDSKKNALIAAGAFLVGRGTSHIFLLRRISKVFPSAILWFGAIASIAGPRCWDQNWARAVRGVEKYLRPQFHWADPSLSDLCWHEYEWLSAVYGGSKVFDSLSKNAPNVISVEVVPGASCQMRLAASVGKALEQEKFSERPLETQNARVQELEAWMAQVLAIAKKGQDILQSNRRNQQEQPSMFKDDPVLSSKAPKKRAKGGAGFDR
ncbi:MULTISPECIES: hypothetical protein [unclassified Janthinobacterium]|uniref:hypothetical protein n=1 Tax=unclassified Janthinobacterium TaxID=2610881 RepID=UPI001607E3CE|nr:MULTISPECIES: hypothetical protein [unclassified Janthinobacterium]MBB5606127.1 hypothetical protein [Janthinobacterium sp. S3T4]MBB5612000.1 hypothetical protein [Janthinobacterium sp. S3M3]